MKGALNTGPEALPLIPGGEGEIIENLRRKIFPDLVRPHLPGRVAERNPLLPFCGAGKRLIH